MGNPNPWKLVIYAHDCEPCDMCEEPLCPLCDGEHYADCDCPGPSSDGYEYKGEDGVEYARRIDD